MTPADSNVKLKKDDDVSNPVDTTLYESMVGNLLYAAIGTRPDISYAVGTVSKFCSNPSEAYMTAVKCIFRYLKGTIDLYIQYQKSDSVELVVHSDVDYAGDMNDRRSTSGTVCIMNNGELSWFSKKQPLVTLSTAEAEHVAIKKLLG